MPAQIPPAAAAATDPNAEQILHEVSKTTKALPPRSSTASVPALVYALRPCLIAVISSLCATLAAARGSRLDPAHDIFANAFTGA